MFSFIPLMFISNVVVMLFLLLVIGGSSRQIEAITKFNEHNSSNSRTDLDKLNHEAQYEGDGKSDNLITITAAAAAVSSVSVGGVTSPLDTKATNYSQPNINTNNDNSNNNDLFTSDNSKIYFIRHDNNQEISMESYMKQIMSGDIDLGGIKNSNSNNNNNNNEEMIELKGICQIYAGETCNMYLHNQSVFIPPDLTMEILEEKLKSAYGVIRESKDMNSVCSGYALPSLCFSVMPTCRTPEQTNHHYFANKAAYDATIRHAKKQKSRVRSSQRKKAVTVPTTTEKLTVYFHGGVTPKSGTSFSGNIVTETIPTERKRRSPNDGSERRQYPPTRNTENLRRICRDDCELLEHELCQKEYAIAKRHPTIGQSLSLEECHDVPDDIDCLKLGIAIDVNPDHDCYWDNGIDYRGTSSVSDTGTTCYKWAKLMRDISDYSELAGHNYCRNPGGAQNAPWCFVDRAKTVELCKISKCADKMWFYIIISFIGIATFIMLFVIVLCCKKFRKPTVANIQNITLPNADKNIYGNSRMNSPIEMTSLLDTNGIPIAQQNTSRGSILRIPQYSLQSVRFLEELGEGAFGTVYKGELTLTTGDKTMVAVKALKENASPKTQGDFKREIELISDLKHDNIVCILGAVLKEEPLCMLFEYMSQGDLHEFLIANSPNEGKTLTQLQFLYISMQISDGMEYLSNHHYVHRDLAARNCLVGDSLTVKISDFGLSRDIYSSDYYRVQSKSLLPVRWMPIESILYGKFTTESDVWSYGVVLWEIYSYGLQPYYGHTNQEVINMVRARQLLPCPDQCPSAVYSLMIECWHEQAVRRPTFPEIGHRLKIWYQAQKRNETANGEFCGTSRRPSSSRQ